MEYATANKWLFSSSGKALSRLSSKCHLIVPVVSGQYSEGAPVVSLLSASVLCLTYRVAGLGYSQPGPPLHPRPVPSN